MKKLFLGACLAAAYFWTNDAGAMKGGYYEYDKRGDYKGKKVATADFWAYGYGKNDVSSISRCESSDDQWLMTDRWKLEGRRLPSGLKYLYVDYTGTGRKFNEEKNPPSKSSLETLPSNVCGKESLKLLHVRSCSEVESIYNPDKGRRQRYERNSRNHLPGILRYESICLKVIPDAIGYLRNLRELDLSDNNLETRVSL